MPVAGWYTDPAGAGYRWWDGSAWTTRVVRANLTAPRRPAPASPSRARTVAPAGEGASAPAWVAAAIAVLVAVGAILLVIGSVQPWVRASAPGVATVTRLGTDARSGWLVIAAGVVAAVEAGRWLQRRRPSRPGSVVAICAAVSSGAVGVAGFTRLAAGVATLPGATGAVTRSAGSGVPLVAAGCAAVFSGAVAAALSGSSGRVG